MNFKDYRLDERIIEALDKLGYNEATEVQKSVLPALLEKQDLIVQAKTGSGKTAAFAIPLIEQIDWAENKPQVLVLTPTRELALQIKEDFDNIGTYKKIKTLAVFGKQPYKFQIHDLKQKTHVVVGTPGRVLDHLERETMDVSKLQYLILDEADEMLNMGFIETVQDILQRLPKNHTTCLFSATMPEAIVALARKFTKDAKQITIKEEAVVNEMIDAVAYEVKEHEKKEFLLKLLLTEMPTSAIIFCKTQEHVNEVCDYLYEQDLSVDKIHGGMLQEDRLDNMYDFRLGKIQFLVATDVAARGIDVENMTHVINYDLPEEAERYIHRIGRTARIGNAGKAISFLSQYDDNRKMMIEEYIHANFQILDARAITNCEIKKEKIRELKDKMIQKEKKNKEIQKDILRLYLNGGKKKKIRPGDIVGAICEIPNVCADDIGIIQVQEMGSYVDILNNKGKLVLETLRKTTIKGKVLKVQISKK